VASHGNLRLTNPVAVTDTARAMHPIKAYRAARGLSLEEFGALIGVGKSVVSKWERGIQPSPESTVKIDEATDGAVPRWMLRPDMWPAPPPHQRVSA
jgi:transcriptional regulator with XRE-family HTH domain